MKSEERIKTVWKCSKCGHEIYGIHSNYDEYDLMIGIYTLRISYKCSSCFHEDTDETVVKEYVTEVVSRPYTNEELEEMIKKQQHQIDELHTMVDQLARALSDHKQGIDR